MSERGPLIYRDEDFPMGLTCCECGRVFSDGESISERLTAFQDDIPIVNLICQTCARRPAGGEG